MIRYAPLPYVAAAQAVPAPALPELGQPAIITDEARAADKYKTVAMVATGLAAGFAGYDAYGRLSKKGTKNRTHGYVSAGFGALSAALFLVLLFEPKS